MNSRPITQIRYVVLILAAFFSLNCFAIEAVATVSKNEVVQDEPFELLIVINDNVPNTQLDLTPLDGNFRYSRPSISSNTTIINGKVNKKTLWRVTLLAQKLGTLTIPSFTINGLSTSPIVMSVSKATAASKQNSDVRLQGKLARTTGYIGETFVYTATLQLGVNVESPMLEMPHGEGLEVTQLNGDEQREIISNGRRFLQIERNYQIRATRPGTLLLNGAVFSGTQIKGGGFDTIAVPMLQKAQPATLTIKDKPAHIQGVWLPTPALELSQQWLPEADTTNGKVGEPINRIITLKVQNTPQSALPDLKITYPDSVRVYEEKPQFSQEGDFSVVTLKQVILPRNEGVIELPSIKVEWFNTQKEQSETTELKGLLINVAPADPSALHIAAAPAQADTDVVTAPSYNPGYWPIATLLFLLLWLSTLLWHLCYRVRSTRQRSQQDQAFDSSFYSLKRAIHSDNPIQILRIFQHLDLSHVSAELKEELTAELTFMQRARYSTAPHAWQYKKLLSLIKKAQKQQKSIKHNATNGLMPL
ncbi:MAG: BatD family protein [Vibrionaceae bacterium]